jgi:hypothetical protein
MREKIVENHFVWAVERIGGKTYKFTSPGRKGVADRIACLPDGSTWFVELKTKGGRLSVLQKMFLICGEGTKDGHGFAETELRMFMDNGTR